MNIGCNDINAASKSFCSLWMWREHCDNPATTSHRWCMLWQEWCRYLESTRMSLNLINGCLIFLLPFNP